MIFTRLEMTRWHGEVIALLVGAAVPLAFAPFGFYPIAFMALGVLFICWRGISARRAFFRGGLFGMGMFGTGVTWIFISIHEYGYVNLALSLFLTTLFVLVLSCFPALCGWLAVRLCNTRRFANPWRVMVLVYPAAWVLLEWVRGWFLTGFPWLNLGYSQIDAPLGALAPILGVYGVSYFVALTAALLVAAFINGDRRIRGGYLTAGIGLWLAAALLGQVHWTEAQDKPLTVSLVQGNIPQEIKWRPSMREPTIELYTRLSSTHWDSDLIIWPETAIPLFYGQAQPYLEGLEALAREHGTEMLVGLVYQEENSQQYFNTMVSVGGEPGMYHKNHLVPFTEYLPLSGLLQVFVDFMQVPMSDFSAGGADQPPLVLAGQKIGVSICYEDAFGEEVIRALPEATVLVNVSNDAWFGGSIAPPQHLEIARMRALESGRYLLRATNTGITAVIDPRGKLAAVAPQFKETVLTASIEPMNGATPYVHLGNIPVALLSAMILAGVFLGRGRAEKRGTTRQ